MNNNTTNNTVNTNNRKKPTNMKTTPRTTPLKTLSLAAAAAALMTPSAEAVDWTHNVTTTVTSGGTYDYGYVSNNLSGTVLQVDVTNNSTVNILNDCYFGYGPGAASPILATFAAGTGLNVFGDLHVGYQKNIVHSSSSGYFGAENVFIGEGITADISIEGSGQMAVTHDLVVTKSRGTLYVRGSGLVLAETVKMAGTADVRNNGTIHAEDFYVGKDASVKVSSAGQIVATTTLCIGAGSVFTFELDPAGQTHSPIVGAGPGMLGEVLDDNWTTTLASDPIDFGLVLNISAVVAPGTIYTLFQDLPFIPGVADPLVVTASSGQQFEKIYDGIGLAVQARAIPEPSTYALLGGVGVLALAVLRRRRGKA